MTLVQAIAAAGMTPPDKLVSGRWMRFPGAGKNRSNRAGWCRVITPTMAIYGDWSSNFSATWRDESHQDDERSRRLLAEARQREREFVRAQRAKQEQVANSAASIIAKATTGKHWYLEKKGFPEHFGLIHEGNLLIPIRDVDDYKKVISAQVILPGGEKRFLPGGRTRGGIYRLGSPKAKRIALCEGYATGLSVEAALKRLAGAFAVIVCFSARNIEFVAQRFPGAFVCADNDESKTGEEVAKRTGLKWAMPPEVGTDFNDLMLREGLASVVRILRDAFHG